MQDVYIGRQPIYGRGLDVYAYELLFRGGMANHADFVEGDRATSQVILNAFTEIGLDRVVGRRLAFLNLTRGFIIGEYPLPMPRDRVVLEVLEDVAPEAEIVDGLRSLKRRGYRIALDDYQPEVTTEPLLRYADIVKVDCLGLDGDEIERVVAPLRKFDCELLAEKIETRQQFEDCREIGFTYFQGFFLSRPNVIRDRALPANRLNLLLVLAELQDPGCTFERVQELVSQDVALSYKFLRHINTALYGLRRRVESVHEALVYLGLAKVRAIACLALLADLSDKPHDLLVTAMLRGKMCEQLARIHGATDPSRAFTTGLLSSLDALMDQPMEAVLEKLPLAPELRAALLRREGVLGEILASALAYERGDWDAVGCLGLTRGQIKGAFLGALEWVERVDQELSSAA